MRKIQCIIKVTNGCNLRCSYCYNSAKHYENKVLPIETLEKFLRLFEDKDCINVIFHGGEPMFVGMDYYRQVMEVEKILTAQSGIKFENQIQTNATLIDDKWLTFFEENKIGVGISFDGIYNDAYRGGTERTLKAIELMKKRNIPFGCIAVVADPHYDLKKNYEYFKSIGVKVDFSCVFPEGSAKSIDLLDIDDYNRQMNELFDEWLYDTEGTQVRNFEFTMKKLLKCNYEYCSNGNCIGNFFCLDTDGTIYGCSRESVKKYPFANIADVSSLHDVLNSENFKIYITGAIKRRADCAAHCAYFEYCKGGCTDDAAAMGDITKPNPSYCRQFQGLFSLIRTRLDEIFAEKKDLSLLNPYAREAIVRAAALADDENI